MSKLLSELARGAWNSATAYTIGDIVDHNGSSYVCIANNTNQVPPNVSFWAILAEKGDTGAQGIQGVKGDTGATGATGATGVSAGVAYKFDTSTTDSDPGNGKMRFNHATIASVTQLFLDNLKDGGGDVSGFIDTWDDSTNTALRGTLTITKVGARENYAVFSINEDVVDGTGYRKVPVTHVSSNGSFSADDDLSVVFTRTGDKGIDGLGAGDVVGPASSTNNNVVLFDGTTGKAIKDGSKGLPTGDVVGTTDTQTLTNKTLNSPEINTPTGDVATKTGAETLSNKTLTSPVITGNITGGAAATFGYVTTGGVNMATNVIENVGDPLNPQDAATKHYVDNNDGWQPADTLVYASATSVTVAGVDVTAKYTKGTRIKLTQSTGGTKYFVVTSSSFSTDTTINITAGTTHTLNNEAITSPFYSYQTNPQGYPGWFTYSPTFSASGSMTWTSVTTSIAKFKMEGATVTFTIFATGTTGGTTSDTLIFDRPPIENANGSAAQITGGGVVLIPGYRGGYYFNNSTTTFGMRRTNPTGSDNFPLASGVGCGATIIYEAA